MNITDVIAKAIERFNAYIFLSPLKYIELASLIPKTIIGINNKNCTHTTALSPPAEWMGDQLL